MLDEYLLRQMMPNAGQRLDAHLPYIGPALDDGSIKTPERVAAFMAELAHESGEYRYMEELADGSGYEGRADLGNIHPGDGVKYKGHGPIQITGRRNTEACLRALGLRADADPRALGVPEYATRAAVWFWNEHKLSLLADRSWFRVITRVINGGYNGWTERLQYYQRNRQLLNLPPYTQMAEKVSIMEYQAANGLVADGDAGARTLASLNA